MAIVINGSGTVTGLAVGGLPDGTVDAGTLAANSVDSAELIDGAVDDSHIAALASSKLTGNLPAINGSALTNLPSASPSAGDVVQVVTFSSTGGTNDGGSFSYQDTHLVSAITPQYSNSKIIVSANCQMYMNNTSGECSVGFDFKRAISGGATSSNISGDASNSTAQHRSIGNGELTAIVPYQAIDTPNTTSAVTYTLQYAGAGSANCIVGWQDKPDTLILTEVKV